MKESWNSVLHLLAYTHNVQLNEILDQRYKTPALTLDINPSWWWLFMFWHCTFGFALVYKHCVKQFKGTLGSIAWVLIHAKLGKSTNFACTVILSPSNNYSLGTLNAAAKTVVSAYWFAPGMGIWLKMETQGCGNWQLKTENVKFPVGCPTPPPPPHPGANHW